MKSERESAAARGGVGDVAQALLVLAPSAWLAWPGATALLRHDPLPQLTGAGAALLAAAPAVAWLFLRKRAAGVQGLTLYLLALFATVAGISFGQGSDTLDASRALLLALADLALLLAAASLVERGRLWLERGAIVVSLALTLPATWDVQGAHSGALGNPADLVLAALAGAVLGASVLLRGEQRVWRVIGACAVLSFLIETWLARVLVGPIALALALLALASLARSAPRAVRSAALACALVALLVALGLACGSRTADAEGSTAHAPGNAGGIGVRLAIWPRAMAMLGAEPWTGVGPGQFAAAFPPWRDPAEIERSSLGRTNPAETEVEHAHNDWLNGLCERGALGLAWIAFLALAVWRALALLRNGDAHRAGFAAASIATLAGAFMHASLSANAVASCLGFACFGVVLAREREAQIPLARRFLGLCVLALIAVQVPRAIKLVQHGAALSYLPESQSTDLDGAARRALKSCPDSVFARTLAARSAELRGAPFPELEREWESVLELRPWRFEAWMQIGVGAARAGERAEARAAFERALALDPGHPGLLRNLVTLELEDERPERAFEHLARLAATHPPPPEWLGDLAARLWLSGDETSARAALQQAAPELADLGPIESFERAKSLRAGGRTKLADLCESRAQRTWAREHAAAGRFADAVRSYRQDLRISRDTTNGGTRSVRLELAAALLAEGKNDDARAEIQGLEPTTRDWARLPEWAGERLSKSGWFAPASVPR